MLIGAGNFVHLALPTLEDLDQRHPWEKVQEREEAFGWDRGLEFTPDIPLVRLEDDGLIDRLVAIDEARKQVERENARNSARRRKTRRRSH